MTKWTVFYQMVTSRDKINAGFLLFFLIFSLFLLFPSPVHARVYIDEVGRKVNITPYPKRIISLAPSITETLFALGLDKEIVGVTMFCNYPPAVRSKPKVGGFINISLERVVSLSPNLIIGTSDGNRRETVEQFERIGLPVYIVNPVSLEDILKMVLDIGRITGKEDTAKKLIFNLRRRVESVVLKTRQMKKPRVFLLLGTDPMITVGRDTLHDKLITLAGGVNVAGGDTIKYPRYSIEEVMVKQPDVIIITSMKREENFASLRDKWKKWKNIPAVRNDRIYTIDTDLITRSSPRIINGLEELVKIIHPELFQGHQH
ncbi:MAG: cobalamin-binding protein [Syntrophales bacterium]|nr:cobalamin-binding protein [Syntrophales bacterium]